MGNPFGTIFREKPDNAADALNIDGQSPPRRRFRGPAWFLALCILSALSGVSWVALAPTSFEAAVERGRLMGSNLLGLKRSSLSVDADPAAVAAAQAAEFAEKLKAIEPRPSGPSGVTVPTRHYVDGARPHSVKTGAAKNGGKIVHPSSVPVPQFVQQPTSKINTKPDPKGKAPVGVVPLPELASVPEQR